MMEHQLRNLSLHPSIPRNSKIVLYIANCWTTPFSNIRVFTTDYQILSLLSSSRPSCRKATHYVSSFTKLDASSGKPHDTTSAKWKLWQGILTIFSVSNHWIAPCLLGPCARDLGTAPSYEATSYTIPALVRLICSSSLTRHDADAVPFKVENGRVIALQNILKFSWLLIVGREPLGSLLELDATAFETREGPQVQADATEPKDKAFQKASMKNQRVAIVFLFSRARFFL